jgi:hypothetical protein
VGDVPALLIALGVFGALALLALWHNTQAMRELVQVCRRLEAELHTHQEGHGE